MSSKQTISNKDLRELAQLARDQGWTVAYRKSGHIRWTHPDGTYIDTSATPRSGRSLENDKARLRRIGLETNPSEVRRMARERRAKAANRQQIKSFDDLWVCRADGCAQTFPSRETRDNHERDDCLILKMMRAQAQEAAKARERQMKQDEQERALREQQAAEAKQRAVARSAVRRPGVGTGQGDRRKKEEIPAEERIDCRAKGCKRFFSRYDNMRRHVLKKHPQSKAAAEFREAAKRAESVEFIDGEPPAQQAGRPPAHPGSGKSKPTSAQVPDLNVEDLTELVFPNGVPMKAGVLEALAKWVKATEEFIDALRQG